MTVVHLERTERLRREYFGKEEDKKGPLRFSHKGAFSFDGHRLSSLYRKVRMNQARLIKSYEIGAPFFFVQILKKSGAAT